MVAKTSVKKFQRNNITELIELIKQKWKCNVGYGYR